MSFVSYKQTSMEMKDSLAVITARGGSKRIPRKNIKDFCGKPILAYSIEAARDSGLFDEIMVSTDDYEIADVAESYGARVPFMRSAKTSDDYATTADVLLEVIEEYRNRGSNFEIMTCIYPTAPFVTPEKLRHGMGMLLANDDVDAVYAVCEYDFPPLRCFVEDSGYLAFGFPKYARMRSQDLTPMVHDAGQFYIYRVNSFLAAWRKEIYQCEHTKGLMLPPTEVQDIDTYEDWAVAELKYQYMLKRIENEKC